MKRKLLILVLIASIGISFGQGTADLMRLSQINYGTSTSRSAAMGGAFTSLGADGISMSINPAGLAMYRSSEVSFTPIVKFGSNSTNYSGTNSYNRSNSKVAIGNFSVIISGDSDFTFGIGYNRLNDFENRSSVYGYSENTSIGQMYMEQLYGVPASDIGSPSGDPYQAFYKYVPSMWNAIMGYQAGLVNPTYAGDEYNMAGLFNYQDGDIQQPQSSLSTSGALHEYSLSGAYNFDNKLYIGLSLNLQNLIYNEEYRYGEVTDLNNTGSLDNFTLKQNLSQNGIGFNFKIGATLNLDYLRIGVAYHSPTWGNFRENSYSNLTVYDKEYSGYGFSDTPTLYNNYKYTTASHFLFGISTTIAKKLILSADYELVTYGSMKYRNDLNIVGYRTPTNAGAIDNLQNLSTYYDGNNFYINDMVKDFYKSASNFRFAVEVRPVQILFLRAGYAYYGSMYRDSALNDYGRYQQYSGGVGLRFDWFSFDIAYVYGMQNNLPSTFFKYIADDGYTVKSSGIINSKNTNHTILLTFGFRPFN